MNHVNAPIQRELNKIVGYNNYAIYPDSYSITTKFFQKKCKLSLKVY